jgi:hypothetical protein
LFVEKNYRESKKFWEETSLKVYGSVLPFPARRTMSNYTFEQRRVKREFLEKKDEPLPISNVKEKPVHPKTPWCPFDRDEEETSDLTTAWKRYNKKSQMGSKFKDTRDE